MNIQEPKTISMLDQVAIKHPPGHIGIATAFLGRYREFDYCMARNVSPPGSTFQYYMSVDVCNNFNLMVRHMLKNPDYKWLWIMGDDHLWGENLLLALLDRNVDVVVPLCCRRLSPWNPILHTGLDKGCGSTDDPWGQIEGKGTGLLAWDGTTGNAGMLIRRHVLESMADPWFENGRTSPGVGASDLYFWHKLIKAGFTPYIDFDNTIGHLTHISVWPEYNAETGKWKPKMIAP